MFLGGSMLLSTGRVVLAGPGPVSGQGEEVPLPGAASPPTFGWLSPPDGWVNGDSGHTAAAQVLPGLCIQPERSWLPGLFLLVPKRTVWLVLSSRFLFLLASGLCGLPARMAL